MTPRSTGVLPTFCVAAQNSSNSTAQLATRDWYSFIKPPLLIIKIAEISFDRTAPFRSLFGASSHSDADLLTTLNVIRASLLEMQSPFTELIPVANAYSLP